MSSYSFTDPQTGRAFAVKVPSGVSEAQARAIFDQQLKTGSLTGVEVGKSLSAATQAAGGLASAQAMVSQTAGGLAGQLPGGANLNTIASALGPAGLAGANQVTGSLKGLGAALSTNTVASNPAAALANVNAAGQAAAPITSRLFNRNRSALTGAAAQAGSLANRAIGSLGSALSGAVTNGINTADLIKQGTTTGIPGLNGVNTQAALSQAAKLVGQPRNRATDAKGVGSFGLNLNQLEQSGLVKRGLSAAAGAGASLTAVLKSPTAFTGKDGIKSLDGLLRSSTAQATAQKGLMTSGLSGLKSSGVPLGVLGGGAVAALALSAAKSLPNTLKSLTGTAPPDVKAEFDQTTKDTNYAVQLAETKVDRAVLGETSAQPADNTVNTETVNAAAQRVVGNDKVPDVANTQPSKIYTEKELEDELKLQRLLRKELSDTAVNIFKELRKATDLASAPQYLEQLQAIQRRFEKIITDLQALQNNANIALRNQRGLFSLGTGFKLSIQSAQSIIGIVQDIDIPFVQKVIGFVERALQRGTA